MVDEWKPYDFVHSSDWNSEKFLTIGIMEQIFEIWILNSPETEIFAMYDVQKIVQNSAEYVHTSSTTPTMSNRNLETFKIDQ